MRYRIVRHYQIKDTTGKIVRRDSKVILGNLSEARAKAEFELIKKEGERFDTKTGETVLYKTIIAVEMTR
jgi:hypothetical protein